MTTHTPTAPHSRLEDIQGLLTGCLFVALGVCMFREAALFTGGTTGVAFLAHYFLDLPLGAVLFVINLPFYVFGWHKLGHAFTIKTFASVGLLSAYVELLPRWITFAHLDPTFAALMAGLLVGTGILILIRHGASLGGVTIMLDLHPLAVMSHFLLALVVLALFVLQRVGDEERPVDHAHAERRVAGRQRRHQPGGSRAAPAAPR